MLQWVVLPPAGPAQHPPAVRRLLRPQHTKPPESEAAEAVEEAVEEAGDHYTSLEEEVEKSEAFENVEKAADDFIQNI